RDFATTGGLGQQKGVDPSIEGAGGTLRLAGGVYLEERGRQIQRQAEKCGAEEQSRHADVFLRRIVRQAVHPDQIQAAQYTERDPQSQEEIEREERRRSGGLDQLGRAKEFEGGGKLKESHHHLDRIEPGAALGHLAQQGRKQRQEEERGGKGGREGE